MPKEIVDKMGIKFVSSPDEKEKDKDNQLLALLLYFLDETTKNKIKELLGEPYFNLKMRKAEKAINIFNNGGKTIDISKVPGAALKAIK
jgi:hypothetical protein